MLNLLTEPQLADELDKSPTTVARWRRDGTGPTYLKVGGSVRYRPEDVETWLDESTVKAGASNSSGARTTVRRVRQ